MSARGRNKGKIGEREFAAFLREHGLDARRGVQHQGGSDSPDVVCSLPGVHWEVKRVERFAMWPALEQAAADAREGDVPVVAHRANRRPWVVVLSAADFLRLVAPKGDSLNDEFSRAHAGALEAALLEVVGDPATTLSAYATRVALAALDEVGDARCSAGLCGHDAGGDDCAATKDEDGDDALLVQQEGP